MCEKLHFATLYPFCLLCGPMFTLLWSNKNANIINSIMPDLLNTVFNFMQWKVQVIDQSPILALFVSKIISPESGYYFYRDSWLADLLLPISCQTCYFHRFLSNSTMSLARPWFLYGVLFFLIFVLTQTRIKYDKEHILNLIFTGILSSPWVLPNILRPWFSAGTFTLSDSRLSYVSLPFETLPFDTFPFFPDSWRTKPLLSHNLSPWFLANVLWKKLLHGSVLTHFFRDSSTTIPIFLTNMLSRLWLLRCILFCAPIGHPKFRMIPLGCWSKMLDILFSSFHECYNSFVLD